MSNENKPAKSLSAISSFERGLLAALGETVDEYQGEVKLRLGGKRPPPAKSDPILKKLQDGTAKIGPTIAEAAESLAKRKALWKEDAYCIFIAHTTCLHCHKHSVRQMDPQVYLRERCTRGDQLNSFLYHPVRGLSNWLLPRLRVTTFHTTFTCEHCFEGLECLPSNTLFQGDIESLGDQQHTLEGSSPSLQEPPPPASSSERDIATSNIYRVSSFLPAGDGNPLNYVMSLSRVLSPPETPAPASDLDSLTGKPESVMPTNPITPTTQVESQGETP